MAALSRRARTRPSPPESHTPARLARLLRPFSDLLELALPQRCPGCGEPEPADTMLCARCVARLPQVDTAVCARCLGEGEPPDRCARHAGDQVHAAWVYDERVALLVHAFKFGGRPGLARAHAPHLARRLPPRLLRHALLASVPLHPARRRERGYDQAACLAEALADAAGVPYLAGLLERTRATRAQSGLGPDERRANVRGAFAVRHPARVAGRRVVVVDDVLTTGATLAECLAVLRAAGAATHGAVLAWAP